MPADHPISGDDVQRQTTLNSRSSTAALEASENDEGVSLLSDHGVDIARYREAIAANERLLSSSQRHATIASSAEADPRSSRADSVLVPGHLATSRGCSPRARTTSTMGSSVSAAVLAAAAAAEAAVAQAAAARGAARSFGGRAGLSDSRLADLQPVGARIEHIGVDMHRSAGELVAEVRELSDRIALAASPMPRQPDSWGEHSDGVLGQRQMLGRPSQSLTAVLPRHKQLESSGGELSEGCSGQMHETGRPRRTVISTGSPAHRSHDFADNIPDSAWQIPHEFRAWEAERSNLLSQISQLKKALEQQEYQSLKQRELQQETQEHEVSRLKKTLHQHQIEQESQVSQLKRELQQQELELAGRPTHRLTQLMRNKIVELERRASPERCQYGNSRLADTRKLIRNDRRRHAAMERQRMQKGDSKEDTEHLVRELCKSLQVTGLADAENAVNNLREAAEKRTAKLNYFVQEVRSLVNSGKPDGSVNTGALVEPGDEDKVLSALKKAWSSQKSAASHGGASADHQLRAKLGQALGCAVARADDVPTQKVLVARAQELCEVVCNHSRILGHFMQLFDVQSSEGCLPAMNVLYSRLGELTTLHKVVQQRFGMYSKSHTSSVADTVRAIERTRPRLQVTACASPLRSDLPRSRSQFHDWSD